MSEQEGTGYDDQVFELLNGDVRVWIEQESIHLVASDRRHHDPVELTAKMARELAAILSALATRIEE